MHNNTDFVHKRAVLCRILKHKDTEARRITEKRTKIFNNDINLVHTQVITPRPIGRGKGEGLLF
jgi:hypothetical protein